MGARYDSHDEFGGSTTWNTTAAFVVPYSETRIKGSYGTSFKAPSLYQLYDSYSGNRELEAEKGKHYEGGFEQPVFRGKFEFGVIYFNNSYSDQIDYNFATSRFENTGEYKAKGYEGFITLRLPVNIEATGTYTNTETENCITGEALLRRPKHKAGISFNWAFIDGANLNIVYTYVGTRYDYTTYPDTAKLDDYYTVDMKLSYWINENIRIYGRVENAGDKKYQEINGYAMPQRAFYAGVEGVI
jgi:vitamin B12 transporter